MWRCAKCGEESDERFDACWQCGTTRAGEAPEHFAIEESEAESPYRAPQNQDPPVAPNHPGRLTRPEIGAIACKVIALWFIAYGALDALLVLGGVIGSFLSRPSYALYLLVPVAYLLTGGLVWLNSIWLAEAIGGKSDAPIAEADWNPQQLLAIAFGAIGAYWSIVRLDDIIQSVCAAAATAEGVPGLWEVGENRVAFLPSLLGLGVTVGIVLGSRKLAAFVFRPRSSVEDDNEGESTD